MLIQFSVENFRSFKGKAVLSMEASKDTGKEDHVAVIGKERILKTAMIFGANASGKSNIFRALTAAILTIRSSNSRQVTDPIQWMVPFAFSEDTRRQPTSFEFVFIVSGEKYVYGFSATAEKVVSEYLYVYHSPRASTIFERQDETYRFTVPSIKKELEPIVQRNTPNKLFLATATAWNAKSTQEACLWFDKIDTFSNNYGELIPRDVDMLENDVDKKLNRFICDLFKKADINISEYELQIRDVPTDQWILALPPVLRAVAGDEVISGKHKEYNIFVTHRIEAKNGKTKDWQLNLKEESKGTNSLFMLSPVLYDAFLNGKIICIDEFDASLHPLLVSYLVSLFRNPKINITNAQLIISAHTVTLLSRRVSRDDEIYFVEKGKETGESELYSLDEFSLRKQTNIRKAYLLGRFGAIPDIEGGDLLW